MTDSLPALAFLAGLAITPILFMASLIWSALHLTESGLLVGSGEVTVLAHHEAANDAQERTVVECPYLTSTGFVEVTVEHEPYGYRGQRDCPWYVDLAA